MKKKKVFGFTLSALPVERPTKFELVINLKAAKQIGLTISAERAGKGGSGNSIGVRREAEGASKTMKKKLFCFALAVLFLTGAAGGNGI